MIRRMRSAKWSYWVLLLAFLLAIPAQYGNLEATEDDLLEDAMRFTGILGYFFEIVLALIVFFILFKINLKLGFAALILIIIVHLYLIFAGEVEDIVTISVIRISIGLLIGWISYVRHSPTET